MSRPKQEISSHSESMKQLIARAAELFEESYDDREQREDWLPSVRAVAEEMNTTVLRARKLLITAGYYSTDISRRVQELYSQGKSIPEIMEAMGLGQASVYSYLPYLGLAWNLDQTTANANRLKLFRRRKYAVEELNAHLRNADAEAYLWKVIRMFEKYPFVSIKGLRFSYTVKRGKNGLPTAEIEISRKEKTITKATINMAFRKALKIQKLEGYVSGPKKIGGFGASYLYPMFLRFGIIRQTQKG